MYVCMYVCMYVFPHIYARISAFIQIHQGSIPIVRRYVGILCETEAQNQIIDDDRQFSTIDASQLPKHVQVLTGSQQSCASINTSMKYGGIVSMNVKTVFVKKKEKKSKNKKWHGGRHIKTSPIYPSIESQKVVCLRSYR